MIYFVNIKKNQIFLRHQLLCKINQYNLQDLLQCNSKVHRTVLWLIANSINVPNKYHIL